MLLDEVSVMMVAYSVDTKAI